MYDWEEGERRERGEEGRREEGRRGRGKEGERGEGRGKEGRRRDGELGMNTFLLWHMIPPAVIAMVTRMALAVSIHTCTVV